MRDIKKFEEITVAYINCSAKRKERRTELKFGWNFVCSCERCEDEGKKERDLIEKYEKSYADQLQLATLTEDNNDKRARERQSSALFMSSIWLK